MAARGEELSTIAERYAGALFDLAREQNSIDAVERSLDRFLGLIQESPDLKRLVRSPLFSSPEQQAGLEAILNRVGISGLVRNFLLVLARNRRLFTVEEIVKAFRNRVSKERGQVEAEVVSAIPLTASQRETLAATLRQKLGKAPNLRESVDPALLGGLIVKIGSQMIDTSLRTKLKNLEMSMKEAG